MVIDSSALLAVIFKEPLAGWVEVQIEKYKTELIMSTVNLTEVLIHIKDRQPQTFEKIRESIFDGRINFVPPTVAQAEAAAQARLEFSSLNLGDCFAYALAMENNYPILTLDSDFKKTDAMVLMP